MVDKSALRTEEKLAKLETKALDEQQKNLFTITSGNFQISKIQIAELKKKINELRQSMQHTENVSEGGIKQFSTGGIKFWTHREFCIGSVWLSTRFSFY